MVKVYTKNGCQPCKATKRSLNKFEISFEEINVDEVEGAREEVIGLGYASMPVVVTETDSWSDFRPDKLDELKARVAAGAELNVLEKIA